MAVVLYECMNSRGSLSLTCHPFPSRITFACRSREIMRLLLDLDPYGGPDPLGMFRLFRMELFMSRPPSQCNVSAASSSG